VQWTRRRNVEIRVSLHLQLYKLCRARTNMKVSRYLESEPEGHAWPSSVAEIGRDKHPTRVNKSVTTSTTTERA
jgi:hypothetical protein